MDTKPEDEFADAIHITKQHRYWIVPTADGANLYFGLLDVDKTIHYFRIHSDDVTSLDIELHELARATRLFARQKIGPFTQRLSHLPYRLPLSNDGKIAPFVGPELKIHRADLHFEELENLINEYSKAVNVDAREIARNDEISTWEVFFTQPPPAAIPLILGDAIHNLRSALDLMVCDLARNRGKNPKRLMFPFNENESELNKRLNKEKFVDLLGQEVTDAIAALRPFNDGGNKLLYALHQLDIQDKHDLILPTYFAAWFEHNMAEAIADNAVKENPSRVRPKIIWIGDPAMRHTSFKEGDVIKRPINEDPLKHYSRINQGLQVRFAGDAKHLAGEPILESFDKLIALVAEILLDFKQRFLAAERHD